MDTALYWMWLADGLGSGYRHARDLLHQWPDPQALYERLSLDGPAPGGLRGPALARLKAGNPAALESRLKTCARLGVQILTPQDIDYPERLRTLPDMPLVLYVTGSAHCLNGGRYVGMVGTRRPTRYGQQACHDLSLAMAQAGAVLVSGLADGLDAEAHRAAVEAGAPTVAFLGTGIDKNFPAANAPLRYAMEEGGGAVVSEYPPDYQGKTTGTFLARNRLIAAQAQVLCVAEARLRSGTLNTVGHAERYGRPVLAVPGSIYSALSQGTNELLRTHRAGVLCRASDVMELLGEEPRQPAEEAAEFSPQAVSDDARAVYASLGPTAQGIDALCAATGLPAGRVLAACTELELYGGAQALPGRRYIAL